jgi:hypothetical protein
MDMVVSRDVNDTEIERGMFPPTTTKLGRAKSRHNPEPHTGATSVEAAEKNENTNLWVNCITLRYCVAS